MEIIYKLDEIVTAEQVAELFRKSGIKRPVDDSDRIQKMIQNADVIVSAWYEDKLVGIARAITDFSYCCYLSDLAVDKDYQQNGIGQRLVELTQEKLGDEVSLILLSSPTALEFYPRIGFEKSDKAFIIPRKK
ncbi:GNAT family N-acetyltransferase [Paenibacillus sp. MMS20-IR301]|uniref:GNAT family N-acetyltransferase n=1 Tax=Paenibacillus sp. MMS20-IR301 TaxID=2895946 RepID=UPI0028F10C7F|nr:GNAT family N-acetyltransferase [Paenibacillus sp. MMS20-IR301]WNS42309.1 GNAT family N-acetyltransferase [Paenibacillus sp. MMS20-IR301]